MKENCVFGNTDGRKSIFKIYFRSEIIFVEPAVRIPVYRYETVVETVHFGLMATVADSDDVEAAHDLADACNEDACYVVAVYEEDDDKASDAFADLALLSIVPFYHCNDLQSDCLNPLLEDSHLILPPLDFRNQGNVQRTFYR